MKRLIAALLIIATAYAYAGWEDGSRVGSPSVIEGPDGAQAKVSDGQLHVVMEGTTSATNSTTNTLTAGSTWTGGWEDILGYNGLAVFCTADQDSATKGLVIQYSSDQTDVHDGESYTYTAGTEKFYSPPPWMRYVRVKFTNGATNQTSFDIHMTMRKTPFKWSSHNVDDSISDEDDAELVINVIKAQNPDGTYASINRSASGNLLVNNAEAASAIAFGDVTGKSIVQKFGNAPDFDNTDNEITIWDGAEDGETYEKMVYGYSTSADITHVSAESALDTGTVEVQGLDASSNLVVQTATLNGTNVVALGTPLYRVFRVKNSGSTDFNDHVFVHTNGTIAAGVPDANSVRAVVHAGNNQTEMAMYTVPADTEVVVKGIYFYSAGANKSSTYIVTLWARPAGGVFQLKWKGSFDDDIDSSVHHPYTTGLYFDEGTDIECRVQALDAAIGAAMSAGFEIETKAK